MLDFYVYVDVRCGYESHPDKVALYALRARLVPKAPTTTKSVPGVQAHHLAEGRNEMSEILHYHAVVADAKRRIQEVLVTRCDGRHVDQQPTGVYYKSMRQAETALAEKNAHLSCRTK